MTYKCFKCGADITRDAEEAKEESPTTVAHVVATEPNSKKETHYAAAVFAVACPLCGQINVFPLNTQVLSLD